MKKSTIIIIAFIYFASIILVGVYGLQYKTFNQIVYATSVEVINPPDKLAKVEGSEEKIKTYFVYKNKETGLRQFQIEWHIEPIETITNKKVRFIYESDKGYTVSDTGLVEFTKGGVVANIKIVPDDGSDCFDVIKIYCMN